MTDLPARGDARARSRPRRRGRHAPGMTRARAGARSIRRTPPSEAALSSRATAPALSSGSLPLPHLGDCTHDGQPVSHGHELDHLEGGRQVAVGAGVAELGDAGAAGVAVVDRRSSGRPVSACSGVDTPPTSHRSQMVNSGSRPMAACSTACSVPGTAGGPDAGVGQQVRGSTVYQNARVVSSPGGRNSSSVPSSSPREACRSAGSR